MKSVFISHPPAAREHYFGDKALQALREFGDVRCNPAQRCDTEAILALAGDCDVLIADRQTEGSAALLAGLPKLLALCRVAVDIRNIDVEAASRHGILVTQASAGFMASVSEWIVGSMIDLSRGISEASAGQAMPDWLCHWVEDGATRRRILEDNPGELYGFQALRE